MGQLTQAVAPWNNSKAPEFKTTSMKAPDSFDGTQAHKLRGFIQSCQFIFHNDPANFFSDRKKVLYSTSFLTGRAGKWIEPYISNNSNEDPSYLLNNWQLFETQLFTLFGYPNEIRKDEQELENLRMKESGHVSLRGLASRPLDQLASYPYNFDTLQEIMDITLELDTRYHERQKEKGSHQERKPPVTGPNSSRPPQNSSLKRPHHKKSLQRDKRCWRRFFYIFTSSLSWGYGPSSLEEQWNEEEPEDIENVLKVVPPAYHQYLDVFSKVKAEKLPPHRTCDHHIELEGLLRPNVEKGLIRPHSSSTGAPVLFVKKKDGGICLCVDYHKLNAVTRQNRYPVPPMNQLLTVFNSSTICSKIDLGGAYNLLRIKEGDEHLTAFKVKYSILQRLRDNNLFAKASKCVFHASNVEYLGYVVSSDGLKMDSFKAQKILNWPQPKKIKALQSFFGFSNFYCSFIKDYSKKITALTSLLKKDSPFIFNEEALSKFQILKEAFTTSPMLSHFNPSLPAIVETDASDYALGAVLSQVNDSGKHPIAFDSCRRLPAELNYEILDKEIPGIVWALKRLRAFLLSLSNYFEVLTDHSSLQHFMSSKVLTCCQTHWAEFLSDFHFTITYRQGRLATLPDALSCRDDMYPERGVDLISKNPQNAHQVIKKDGIKESRFFSANWKYSHI
ncbi:hypothetical protein O181_019622 [Austropuccinia psidii MF-1]|uniref:Reverse transcriptase/retrotransposon-derived protein RNase H-like domain-containing protein n=1 Tax=Austropuccinia psidii MF-1 TaxID=1389203 RepID=A0A9Q3GUL2_9BASI|nr:hypothetical protein [Austropuccinia psidii MF-1]